MATSITESPVWINKMKIRFASMDVDKNGRVNVDDISILAKKFAGYRKEGKEDEKRYFDALMLVYSYATRGAEGTNEEEFVEGMKEFVAQSDARQRVNGFAAMLFEVMDTDKNGVISFDEFMGFHKASNTKLDEELLKGIFMDADTNRDGVIQPSELEESLAKFFLSA